MIQSDGRLTVFLGMATGLLLLVLVLVIGSRGNEEPPASVETTQASVPTQNELICQEVSDIVHSYDVMGNLFYEGSTCQVVDGTIYFEVDFGDYEQGVPTDFDQWCEVVELILEGGGYHNVDVQAISHGTLYGVN